MEAKYLQRYNNHKRFGLLANIFVPLGVMLAFGLFYLSFAAILLIVVPIISAILLVQFFLFKRKIKKMFATNTKR
ncbi:hypothetical protein A2Y26_03280 [candidate division CPR2 bacterium GWD2_39_7]|nr:MAG: hypothetical protein A2Y27_02275 [candidate division CPR2 bacterium GWD1_39_7]OGB72419.1 MAG: hypothetical protein A2Y26_03280 [candidate division CPR2 bacterium GWD2_39_7]HCL99750.1 hypothetical protein [candidate division CPR2 bacterium]